MMYIDGTNFGVLCVDSAGSRITEQVLCLGTVRYHIKTPSHDVSLT